MVLHRKWWPRSALALVATAALAFTATPALARGKAIPVTRVIVQQWNGADPAPLATLLALGGTVTAQLPIVGGFAATLPTSAIGTLAASAGVRVVSPDGLVLPDGKPGGGGGTGGGTTPKPSPWRDVVGANTTRSSSQLGQGVTIALIDTGVANVADLASRIVPVTNPATGSTDSCVNFSSETGCADSYGHGTFVAGLMAGNGGWSKGTYAGVAPAARVLSVKLSGRDGTSNVTKVLLALQWVLANKDTYGVKVINLSLRVDSNLSYRLDPVNLAVERAWAAGLVVVASAGNMGPAAGTIAKPADDPWVISVGSTDDQGTSTLNDDVVSDFSSRGPTPTDGVAKPDLVTPGRHLVSLRSPGSEVDKRYPVFVDSHYRFGSGTSFSAGIVSGAAAVLLGAQPTATNDRVKYALTASARPFSDGDSMSQGAGVLSLPDALAAGPGEANRTLFQPLLFGDGVPSDADLDGTIYGTIGWSGSNWQGSNWQTTDWTATTFDGSNWQGSNWQGSNWQGSNWQGSNWQGSNWQSGYWT